MKKSDIKYGAFALCLALSFVAGTQAKDAAKPTKSESSKKANANANLNGDKCKVSVVYNHELPNVPGKSIKGILVEYGPGGSTPCHTHPKSAFIYATVLEGSITSQVNDGPVVTYKKGENFSENPGDKHGISKNGSNTKPAKLLAVFVVDSNEQELTTMCKD